MVLSAGIIAICMSSNSTSRWVYHNGWYIGLPACFVAIFCQIAIYCCKSVRRMVPHNYIILFIFTLCFGFFAAQECVYWTASISYVNNELVLVWENNSTIYKAAISTAMITGAVTLYAFTTKIDFNVMRGMLFVFAMALTWFFILSLCFGYWMTTFWSSICVCLYGLFLLCDTQLIIKKGRHGLSIDDYVAGAMLIYSDIIMIFIYMI
jgi:FtsH-binding integral membrane protein